MSALSRRLRRLVGTVLAFVLCAVAVPLVAADGLGPPEGSVILTVDGAIAHGNDGAAARFDRAMLEALGTAEIATTTDWTDGVTTFRGVPATAVFDRVGATGATVRAEALNDYSADIPMEDFEKFGVLLAMEMDGRRLSVRSKGPIWIVYPRDDFRELENVAYNSRWVWQVRRLTVR